MQETKSTNLPKSELLKLFEPSGFVLLAVIKGITHEQSLKAPGEGGNSANWVLAHLLYYRTQILRKLGDNNPLAIEGLDGFAGQGNPASKVEAAIDWQRLCNGAHESQGRIRLRIEGITESELCSPTSDGTVADDIRFLHFHDSYHIGQLGYIRRMLGLPGAIG
jgi:hypothetical protein